MDNVLRLQAREAGGFTRQQNRVNFSIPANGTWDLANSYVSLMGRIQAFGDPGAVYSVGLNYTEPDGTVTDIAPPPACLVKNSRLTSSKFGIMEDIQRPDIFFSNISTLEMSVADIRGAANQYPILPFESNLNKGSVWRELHKEGNVKSRELVSPIKLPLSQCLALGKHTLDTTALGRLDVFLELQLDRFRAVQLLDESSNLIRADYTEMQDVTGIGAKNTLQTKFSFQRLEDSPYFVGQSLEIVVGEQGSAVLQPPAYVIVQSIEWSRAAGVDAGTIVLTFSTDYATFVSSDNSWKQVSVKARNTGTGSDAPTFFVEYAEITLQGSSEKVDMKDGLTYSTITTEQDNGNGLLRFRKQYFIEPECYNVWTCFPDVDDDLRSNMDNIVKWRLRLDGEDLSNRDIELGSPLDYDRTSMTMLNGGRQLKSLISAMVADNTQVERETFSQKTAKMICNPVPITSVRKQLDFAIDSQNVGLNKIAIFKEVSRTIKM